ncbi:MAG: HepT-like ribonuclease domain-containing protein [Candidatus Eremiobacterota bacterium]
MAALDDRAVADFARQQGLDFVVLFGSRATGRARESSDYDLAIMPGSGERNRDAVERRLVRRLRRADLDLVWLPHAGWLLASRVAAQGRLVNESRPGRFRRFAVQATLRRADSRIWHERNLRFVRRVLERDTSVDQQLVTQKLASMSQYLAELGEVLEPGEPDFTADFRLFRTAERNLELLVEYAAAINTEVAQAVAGIPPSDYYTSFFSLASARWLEQRLARRLAEMAGLKKRLVHHYDDVDLKKLFRSLKRSLPDWRAYLACVAGRLNEP